MLTQDQIAALPHRPCVGVALINADGLLFGGRRIDNPADAWQMPQGGIDPGEDVLEAALRELGEETGVTPDKVEPLRESAGWVDYDLPPELMGKLWKGRYRGQTQKWWAFRFTGSDADVDIATPEAEFDAWRWMDAAEMRRKIVPFKRDVYDAVFREFADLLGGAGR